MNDLNYTLEISHSRSSGVLQASFFLNENFLEQHQYSFNFPNSRKLFFLWLINISKNLFFNDHFYQFKFRVIIKSEEVKKELEDRIKAFVTLIQNTQAKILEYLPLFNDKNRPSPSGSFFYNVDNLNTFHELHEVISSKSENIFYENCHSGWNKVKRVWEKGEGFSSDLLFQYLLRNNIKHIYSVNMYYLLNLTKEEHFLLLPCIKAFNLEWITLDYDVYDLDDYGYLQKSAYNYPSFKRFSIFPHITKDFDAAYNNTNIIPFLIGDIKEDTSNITPLLPHPDVIVISQARIYDLLAKLPETLFFLEMTDSSNQYLDIQKLFHSLKAILFSDKKIPQLEKERIHSNLSAILMNAISILKYDVLETLEDNKIKTLLYGDEYWNYLFPSSYQNKFLNETEIKTLFSEKKHLYLLPNLNYSYLENNPVFHRSFNLRAPYLSFPALVIPNELRGLKNLEFKNSQELINKLPLINNLIQDQDFLNSFCTLKSQIRQCRSDFYKQISGEILDHESSFTQLTNSSRLNFESLISEYLKQNSRNIFFVYNTLINEQARLFPLASSKFSQKRFFAKIVQAYGQLKASAA